MSGREAQSLQRALRISADDLHPATLVEDHAVLPCLEVGIRTPASGLGGRGRRLDRETANLFQPGASEIRLPDVELDVAETVEVEHFAADLAVRDLGRGQRQRGERRR